MFCEGKNKTWLYVLAVLLLASVCLNIYFIYKLKSGGVWPPENMLITLK